MDLIGEGQEQIPFLDQEISVIQSGHAGAFCQISQFQMGVQMWNGTKPCEGKGGRYDIISVFDLISHSISPIPQYMSKSFLYMTGIIKQIR